MATKQQNLFTRFFERFASGDVRTPQTYTDKSVTLGVTNEYSAGELISLSRRHYVNNPELENNTYTTDMQVLNSLQPTHREITYNISDAERLKALDPNIKRVEAIVVSSIMSPNDLQDVDPEIVVELDELDADQKSRISELLQNFYCNIYGLRAKMTSWVKEAHFRSGAGVAVILPEATLTSLINTYDPNRQLLRAAGKESLFLSALENKDVDTSPLNDLVIDDTFFEKVYSHSPYSSNIPKAPVTGKEGIKIGNKPELKMGTGSFEFAPTREIVDRVMSDVVFDPDTDGKTIDEYRSGIESMVINFAKAFSKKSESKQQIVDVLDNPDIIPLGKMIQQKKQKKLNSIIEDSILGKLMKDAGMDEDQSLYYQDIPIIDLTKHMTDSEKQRAFPFEFDWPAEALIPVCVPGSRSQRLGGFGLIDAWGQPVVTSSYIQVGSNGNSASDRISVAYNAMYGEAPTESGIKTLSGSRNSVGAAVGNCGCNKENLVKVFNCVLDEMLKRKLQDVGFTDVTLGKYNAIAQCMLYRLLEKKKTSLIFIPEKYLTYLAFEYHADGTGKSKIEDILYMESLKISLMTANSLATMKSAVPIKKVKLNCDPKQKNTMQTLFMMRDAILRRETLAPSTWPAMNTSQMLAQNLSIELAHPNATDLSFTVEDTHRELPQADVQYLKTLDDQTITGLGSYPSAIAETGEVQFAKSLATTNLYYAQATRQDQVVVEDIASQHVRKHLILSSVLLYKIIEIIEDRKPNSLNGINEPKEKSDIADGKNIGSDGGTTIVQRAGRELNKDSLRMVYKVIDNLHVKLSPPDVAPNDTQYNILTEMIKRIDEYVMAMYPNELGTFGEEDLTKELNILRASIKATMIREVANTLGFRGLLSDVPDLTEHVLKEDGKLVDTYGILHGFKERIKREEQARQKKLPEEVSDDTVTDESVW